MIRFTPAIGVCTIILLGSAMSACAPDGNYSGAPGTPTVSNADCQPGICVGSTPGSTPDYLSQFGP